MSEDGVDWKKLGLQTDEEFKELQNSSKFLEEEGSKNILKYFDRIHNKLFTFNNILIGGFFALYKIENSIPVGAIVIPILNLVFLIYIEYQMMERSRFQSTITEKNPDQIKKYKKRMSKINWYSLRAILSTFVVLLIFLCYLFI